LKNFKELDLIEPLQRAIAAADYHTPTAIQSQAIPPLLEGRDLLGCAQTGTGKTAAFALPVLQLLDQNLPEYPEIRALVLCPTRELAIQVAESFDSYGKHLDLHGVTLYGGVSDKPQIEELKEGVDWVVACPGRLLDLMGRGFVDLSHVEMFVLDEADRMLDMGFINDLEKIMKVLPKKRQNLLFSATIPDSISKLARSLLHKPVSIDIAPETPTVEKIDQSLYFVAKRDKKRLLLDLVKETEVGCGIVFTRTKHGANRLTQRLNKAGVDALAIHGNKSQGARQRALDALKSGKIRLLVGTDVAARGIDVDDVTHVFNYDLPNEPEVYVHRIGRTGRGGRAGTAIAFCDSSERGQLSDIEKLIGERIEVIEGHGYPESYEDESSSKGGNSNSNSNSNRNNNNKGSGRGRRRGRRGGRGQGKSQQQRSRSSK
jgi:ATP-dependent RNA helicase RhlE